ncbi:MAG: 4Fe-4S binding protein [Candidatus Cloacimonetes bacterium]|nr:4Fe-4S binding protein [Candidatus Cloacimonadota bacterium]
MRKLLVILLLCVLSLSLFALIESGKPTVWRQRCVGCGDCVERCPVSAITLHEGKAIIDADACIDCKICVTTCQYRAIR